MRTALPEAKPVDWKAAAKLDPDWRLFARSAGDDKGSIQALISAFDALKEVGIKPSVNIKLLYEGEEEQGSPHFAALVAQHLDLVRGDLLIMGDGPMHQSGKQEIQFRQPQDHRLQGRRSMGRWSPCTMATTAPGRPARRS